MSRKRTIWLLVACYFAYSSIYIARVNLSVASPDMIAAGKLTAAQFGFLGSAFSIVYAIGRFFSGQLSDRYPPARMIGIGLALAAAANIGIGFLPPYLFIVVFCAVNAFAQSMLWGSVLRIVAASVDGERRTKATSIMVTTVSTGTVLGYLLGAYFVSTFGFVFAFFLPAAICLVCCVWILLAGRTVQAEALPPHQKISLTKLFSASDVRTGLLPAFLHGIVKDNVSLWLPAFFVQFFSIDLKQSVWFVLVVPLVGLVGRLAYPLFYRLCKEREQRVNTIGFAVCILASVRLMLGGVRPVGAAVCFGLIYAAVSLVNTSFLSIYPLRFLESGNVASVSGIMDLLTYSGAGVGSMLLGVLIDKLGYFPMFVLFALAAAASLLLILPELKKKKTE